MALIDQDQEFRFKMIRESKFSFLFKPKKVYTSIASRHTIIGNKLNMSSINIHDTAIVKRLK